MYKTFFFQATNPNEVNKFLQQMYDEGLDFISSDGSYYIFKKRPAGILENPGTANNNASLAIALMNRISKCFKDTKNFEYINDFLIPAIFEWDSATSSIA